MFHGGQKRTIGYDILFPVYIRNFFREDGGLMAVKNQFLELLIDCLTGG